MHSDAMDFDQIKSRLSSDPPMPWIERQHVAIQVGRRLCSTRESGQTTPCVSILAILAEDQKWEVRKAVADSLVHLHSGDFDSLATRLAADSNAWVRKAAERTISRRKSMRRVETRKQEKMESVFDDYNWFLNKYGRATADRALHVGEKYFEMLAGAATHEIRGVLTSLIGDLDHLAGNDLPAPERRARIDKTLQRSRFLCRIVDDLKGYAQELSRDGYRRENLRSIVQSALELANDKLRAKDKDLASIDAQNDVPDFLSIEGSRHQLVQAFDNIIRNAIESIEEAGHVLVTAELSDGRLDVTVQDTGVGMTDEEMRDAFIPFRTSKKNEGGTGLGLPTAKKIIESHGGAIVIRSQVDRGTTVTITLPMSQEERLDA